MTVQHPYASTSRRKSTYYWTKSRKPKNQGFLTFERQLLQVGRAAQRTGSF
ncbi:hypothetical protein [Nostoc sp. LPT]|uniref:hypothetical protein n=1 Tax=Nostoc sp. LPT TaxID=2815387 RepID=UPI001D40020F|nr:hypothetical protein [Nostoc sp. LPT]MBN4002978.1 hypothetical protein [Nostoc sp. LPT]